MRKIALVLILMLGLSACIQKPVEDGKIRIVVSFYILEDFTKKIGGDLVTVINLTQSAGEPHEFEPSTQDMKILSDAKHIMILGYDFEPWFYDVYDTIKSNGLDVLVLSDGFETIVDQNTQQIDPHIWTSITNAQLIFTKIKDYLIQLDPTHASSYTQNYELYNEDFNQLKLEYSSAINDRVRNEFVTNHAAFGYLAQEFGLTMIPIMGLEPDAEPSASVMAQIIDVVKLYKIPYILYEDEANTEVAKTIAKETGALTGILRPIESLNSDQRSLGKDYFNLMRENLEWLKKALN
jgi:zinc transport system substrate-binding protein